MRRVSFLLLSAIDPPCSPHGKTLNTRVAWCEPVLTRYPVPVWHTPFFFLISNCLLFSQQQIDSSLSTEAWTEGSCLSHETRQPGSATRLEFLSRRAAWPCRVRRSPTAERCAHAGSLTLGGEVGVGIGLGIGSGIGSEIGLGSRLGILTLTLTLSLTRTC